MLSFTDSEVGGPESLVGMGGSQGAVGLPSTVLRRAGEAGPV